MILIKREEAKRFSTVPGVDCKILATGEKLMLVLMELAPSAVIPLHSHINEQVGLCLRGSVEFQTQRGGIMVKEKMSYVFKSNEEHGCQALKEGATLLEAFSPLREDFLALVK